MMRFCGVMLLMLSVTGMGLMRSSDLRQRPRALRSMIHALSLLRDDIVSRSMQLPDAMAHTGGMTDGCCSIFFVSVAYKLTHSDLSFRDVWEEEIRSLSIMGDESLRTLSQLGKRLGTVDAQAQDQALDMCIGALEKAQQDAYARAAQYGRLYTGLSMTLGAMLAVVLY